MGEGNHPLLICAVAAAEKSRNNFSPNGSKDRRDSGDDPRSSPASSSTSNVAIAAAAAAAAAAAQFNATVSASEASSDRGTPPRGVCTYLYIVRNVKGSLTKSPMSIFEAFYDNCMRDQSLTSQCY